MFDSSQPQVTDPNRESGSIFVEAPGANLTTLLAGERLLERFLGSLDVEVLDPAFTTAIFEHACRIEKLGAGLKTLVSARAAAASNWKAKGEQSAAHWLARRTGTSVGNAATVLETAQRVSALPQTQEALRRGKISEAQAKHIASAAGTSPKHEEELLKAASTEGFGSFVDRCNRIRVTTDHSYNARRKHVYSRRYLRKWTDPNGAFRIDGSFTVEHGAEIWAALAPYAQEAFEDARASGRKEHYDAYSADGLLAMARDARGGSFDPKDSGTYSAEESGSEALTGGDAPANLPGLGGPEESPDGCPRQVSRHQAVPQGPGGSSSRTSPDGMNRPAGPAGPGGPPTTAGPAGPGGPPTTAGPAGPGGPPTTAGPAGPGGPPTTAGPAGPGGPPTTAGPAGPGGPSTTAGPAGHPRAVPNAALPGDHNETERASAGETKRRRRPPPVCIDILVDYNALIRGKALPGETCEIEGIGPVPIETVKYFENDAYLWVLLVDGHDIKSVSRMGRYISPRLRKALYARDRKCVVPGCDIKRHLEMHHVKAVTHNGPTELANLALLCRHHHFLVTYRGFRLEGNSGGWSWCEPGRQDVEPRPGSQAPE